MRFEEIIARLLNEPVERIHDGSSRQNVANWNSIRHVELVLALEEHFRVKFTRLEVGTLSSVGELRAALREKGVSV